MNNELTVFDASKKKIEEACVQANKLDLVNNVTAAFTAVNVIKMLREALTDDIMKEVFMPLMNTKIGFLTDRTNKPDRHGNTPTPYSIQEVKDAMIDAMCLGIIPTGNQFNIITGKMYPTKEGYTALLKKLGVKYIISYSQNMSSNPDFAEIQCKISYEYNGEKSSYTMIAVVSSKGNSSYDFIKGKAERRAKKSLFEYLTGCDLGDADAEDAINNNIKETPYVDLTEQDKTKEHKAKLESCTSIKQIKDYYSANINDIAASPKLMSLMSEQSTAIAVRDINECEDIEQLNQCKNIYIHMGNNESVQSAIKQKENELTSLQG